MKKRKVAKRAKSTRAVKTRTRKVRGEQNFIYGLEQEFVLIFGGGAAVVILGVFLLLWK